MHFPSGRSAFKTSDFRLFPALILRSLSLSQTPQRRHIRPQASAALAIQDRRRHPRGGIARGGSFRGINFRAGVRLFRRGDAVRTTRPQSIPASSHYTRRTRLSRFNKTSTMSVDLSVVHLAPSHSCGQHRERALFKLEILKEDYAKRNRV